MDKKLTNYRVEVVVKVESDSRRNAAIGFFGFLDRADEVEIQVYDAASDDLVASYIGSLNGGDTYDVECIFSKDGKEV